MTLLCLLCAAIPNLTWAAPIPAGHPNKGTLDSALNLSKLIKENKKILASVSPEEFQYGTTQMDNALKSIGNWGLALQGLPVLIGDISKKQGGKIARHLTHQRGLDADIAYLVHAQKKTGHRAKKFHNRFTEQFGMNGKLGDNFALESNFQLFKNIFQNLEVKSIYVGCEIYDALLAFAAKEENRPNSIMEHIYAQKGHEDHFHLRLSCPKDAPDCSNKWWTDPTQPPKAKKEHPSGHKFRDC